MPKTTDYDWTTDPVVLKRLERSPVKGFRTDGFLIRSRSAVDGVCWYKAAPDDAHHIEAAWRVELVKVAGRQQPDSYDVFIMPYSNGGCTVSIGCWDEGYWEVAADRHGPPIRAYALALDWLEAESRRGET